jgi:serine protease Do
MSAISRTSRHARILSPVRRAAAPLGWMIFAAFFVLSPASLVLSPDSLLVSTATAQDRGVPHTFADLADKVLPAVVNIASTKKAADTARPGRRWVPQDSPFGDMMRRYWDEQQDDAQRQPSRALGSGFVIDSAGYIATNNHVIDGADEITVTLQDGRQLKAKLVGTDRTTDLALLKVDGAGDLPAVRFGDSPKTRVGDWVMAVGNPFNLGGTVTVGVLSARNRDLRSGPYDDYLQIDAPINRGNSGGPLFNLEGQVIGINTAIYSTTGGNIGIGFAIPATIAAKVLDQLKTTGKVERGWLGVYVQPLTEDLAKALGLDRPRGALIAQVQDSSPAAKAGLKAGEVVLAIGGKPIDQSRELARHVAEIKPGSTVNFTVWRDKKEATVPVTLQESKRDQAKQGERPPSERPRGDRGAPLYGLALADLDGRTRDSYGIPGAVEGVLVARVQPGSPAAEQGLEAGDVIVSIGSETVARAADATKKLDAAKANKQPVVLLISRQGVTRFVVVKAEQG